MTELTIGQVAKAAGISADTVRFYERKGLVAAPRRKPSGYRQYSPDAVRRLRFIAHAKELGFTLKEIDELLALRVDPDATCADVKARALAKKEIMEKKIAALTRMKNALAGVASRCRGKGPTGTCPILDELDKENADEN
ncbi:heavy metal-responsive transcriptional regulator [bacterium]|nr:heavy metal-responsive transcriptional regulator [bacterium]